METSMTWGDIMDAEDNTLENVELCIDEPWTTKNISQGEKQTAVEKVEEQDTEPPMSWGDIMDALDNEMENMEPVYPYEPWSTKNISQGEEQTTVEKVEEQVTEPPMSWGDIMDALDNEMENVEPVCPYDAWSANISQVEEQKVEKKEQKEHKTEEKEEQKEQAKIHPAPVRPVLPKNLPEERLSKSTKITKLLLRNLDYRIHDGRLYKEFLPFGHVVSAKVIMENGRSSGTGVIIFSSPDEARRAIMEMNGRFLGRRPVYIGPAQTKEERGAATDPAPVINRAQRTPHPLKAKNPWSANTISQVKEQKEQKTEEKKEQAKIHPAPVQPVLPKKLPKEHLNKSTKITKLLLRNLDYRIHDGCLYKVFLPFGNVVSAKVMMENGRSSGTGFVLFSSPDEARRAIMGMNGRFLGRRPVYISRSQTKEEHGAGRPGFTPAH